MEAAAPPAVLADPGRLEALRATALLDSPPEEAFDRLTRLASHALNVPVALVSLVADDRQFFKSCLGVAEPWASRRGTPLSHSFCQHPVASRALRGCGGRGGARGRAGSRTPRPPRPPPPPPPPCARAGAAPAPPPLKTS